MNLKPSENTKLFEMNDYFKEFSSLYNRDKMPNKILLSGKKGIGKSTLAYHIINYTLSRDEEFSYDEKNQLINLNNRSFKLLQKNAHPNFYLIDLFEDKKIIDIAQIRQMITYTNMSSFNNTPRFILIDNVENLNKNSINALLKIIEEPNQNIYFILIHNNEKKILPTLKSRCLTFNIKLSFDKTISISNKLISGNIFEMINHDLISYYNTPGEFISLINFANEKKIDLMQYSLIQILHFLIDNNYYKKNKFIRNLLINFIELYFLKTYKISILKNSFLIIYQNFLNKIINTEKFNLDEDSLFLEFKLRILNG